MNQPFLPHLNKAQRASLRVVCPTCGAKVSEPCKQPLVGFAHTPRYMKANRIGHA